jgi:hypothetical protein
MSEEMLPKGLHLDLIEAARLIGDEALAAKLEALQVSDEGVSCTDVKDVLYDKHSVVAHKALYANWEAVTAYRHKREAEDRGYTFDANGNLQDPTLKRMWIRFILAVVLGIGSIAAAWRGQSYLMCAANIAMLLVSLPFFIWHPKLPADYGVRRRNANFVRRWLGYL